MIKSSVSKMKNKIKLNPNLSKSIKLRNQNFKRRLIKEMTIFNNFIKSLQKSEMNSQSNLIKKNRENKILSFHPHSKRRNFKKKLIMNPLMRKR